MSVLWDLLGSTMMAGLVLLMGLQLNSNMANGSNAYRDDVVVQEGLVNIVQAVEYDFRKMGYNVADPTSVILRADSNHIAFLADLDDNGAIDTVEWYIGRLITSSPNPNDRLLFRRTVGPGLPTSLVASAPGVTKFGFRFLNQEGMPTAMKSQIWIIETTIRVESPWKGQSSIKLDDKYANWDYSAAFWRQTRLAGRNLKRHG
jgi:hypothetical protein